MSCKKHTAHNHHVIPRYAGGVETTPIGDVCHTMWHFASWKRTQDPRERGAYLLLRGQLDSESMSQKMIRLWSDPVARKVFLDSRSKPSTERMSAMGKLGGSADSSTSGRKAMSQLRPQRQLELMTQNNEELKKFVGKWLTFVHTSGVKYTTRLDYSLKPITEQMTRLVGNSPSSQRLTDSILTGAMRSGWQLNSTSM